MAIQFVGSKFNSNGGNAFTVSLTTLTGGISASAAADDLVIVLRASDQSSNVSLPLSGYTQITDQYANVPGSSHDPNHELYYKKMGSTPDTSVSIGASPNSNDHAALVMVFRGVDTSNPFDATAVSVTATVGTSIDPGAITPAHANACILVMVTSMVTSSGMVGSTGYSTLQGGPAGPAVWGQYKILTAAAAENPGVWFTSGSGGDGIIATTMALRAAVSAGGQAKVWNGSAFVAKPVKVWSGSAWVTKPVKVRSAGGSWVTTSY